MTVPREPGEEPEELGQQPGGRRRDARLVLTGVILVLGVWFALANTQEVKVHFWIVSTRSPVIGALAIAAACGATIGVLLGRHFRRPPS